MRSERGAIIIHVALALMALLLFLGFVMDQGAFFVARRQAQNAADAAALGAAMELQFNPTSVATAQAEAATIANLNAVWGEAVGAANTWVSDFPIDCFDPANPKNRKTCIQVDVYRGWNRANQATGNPITLFLTGISGAGPSRLRATAKAEVAAANTVQSCIKPWAVVDRWVDHSNSGTDLTGYDQMDVFNPGVDEYVPSEGYRARGTDNDIGLQLMLKGEGSEWSSGWSMTVDLGNGNGGNVVRQEIAGCPTWVPAVGIYDGSIPCSEPDHTNEPKGCLNVTDGVKQGPTTDGVGDLVLADQGAYWDSSTNTVAGGCTAARNCSSINPLGINLSPRIVPVALFNPQAYLDVGGNGNNGMARVVNVMGFFVEGMCSDVYPSNPPAWCGSGPQDPAKTVVGRLMTYPGQYTSNVGPPGPNSFLVFTRLVQ